MPFDKQPTLRGDLLELLPLRPDDFDALYTVACNPLIWEQHPAKNRHEPAVFRAFFDDALASGGALLAIDRATGAVIGSSRTMATTKRPAKSKSAGRFSPGAAGAGRTTAK